jgi:hypothetical protein
VPLVVVSIYFLLGALMPNGVLWPVHLWAGSIWLAAAAGLLLSFARIPAASSAVGLSDA